MSYNVLRSNLLYKDPLPSLSNAYSFLVYEEIAIKTCINARALYHRLGHIPIQKLKEVFGFDVLSCRLGHCDTCHKAK